MDWSGKYQELQASYGDALAGHEQTAGAHIQKKFKLARPIVLENHAVSRADLTDGEMIEACIGSGFDSTDFAGLLDKMTADYYAKLEELCGS